MIILGISAFYHDSAACLIRDGEIIAAAQEERFTRIKHDPSFPMHAVKYCLAAASVSIEDVDYVSFYDKPFLKFERIMSTFMQYAPKGLLSFLEAVPVWIKQKLWIKENIRNELGYDGEVLFMEHHISHAASAFFPSPFEESAFLTLDGVGEWATSSYGKAKGNSLSIECEMKFPHSLGLLYSAFTYYCGFRVNSGEYKLMGLAPYGNPEYKKKIYDHLIDVKKDGSFRLNLDYFDYCAGQKMTSKKFDLLFGQPARQAESDMTQFYMDMARSIQEVTEEIILKIVDHVYEETKCENLCLAGGVALNCVANGRIARESRFKNIWVQPASGDAGGALGAALFTWFQVLKNPRDELNAEVMQKYSYLGPQYSDQEIEDFCTDHAIPFHPVASKEIHEHIADLIHEKKVIGLFQGPMEFGPRALGNRSIIGDPRSDKMQQTLNLKIKFRESFRPFAPSVLAEVSEDYFDFDQASPYMLFVAPVKDAKIPSSIQKESFMDRIKAVQSPVPAITHVDGSARLQTVSKDQNSFYHSVIHQFYQKYGCPVIINTSFNVRGEPIVQSPEDAYLCFMRTHMDVLVLGNHVLYKKEQPELESMGFELRTYGVD